MDFIKKAKKELEKSGIVVGSSEPPRYWTSTGNHVLNKIISGSFMRGLPQGRVVTFAGPSQGGKSFLLCNAMREAQKAGSIVAVIDTESALDDDFVSAVGVDTTHEDYFYTEADTIPEAVKIASQLIMGYKKDYGSDPDAPKMLIAIDSLDMLSTETENEQFSKGEITGDRGQRNKQLKQMLREFISNIKHLNVTVAATSQVYKNQDLTNGQGIWIISDAVQYAPSIMVLLTKLKLREGTEVKGIRMRTEGFKTRFTQPYQSVTIEVPYETGMDRFNGLYDVAKDMDVVEVRGAWKFFGDHKWQASSIPEEHCEAVLKACEAKREQFLESRITYEDIDFGGSNVTAKSKRKAKQTGDSK